MNSLWKKSTNDYESSAKVVDGNLILSLPDAINPVVWRMELGSVKASALEVKQQSTDGTFLLSLKTPKGEVHDIAPFQTREHAVRALMRVSAALQGAHGKIVPVAAPSAQGATTIINTTEKDGGSTLKWLLMLGGVLLVIFLFAFLSAVSSRNADVTSAGQPAIDAPVDEQSGTPQSADDLLRGY
jgi:hypothetical protein